MPHPRQDFIKTHGQQPGAKQPQRRQAREHPVARNGVELTGPQLTAQGLGCTAALKSTSPSPPQGWRSHAGPSPPSPRGLAEPHTKAFARSRSLQSECLEHSYSYTPLPHLFFFFLSLFFMASPAAYGSSQARGQIRVTAGAHATAMVMPDLSCICNLCLRLVATLDP